MEQILFLKEFFKHWREVGSVIPSSHFLVKKLASHAESDRPIIIVELGPGVGNVTREILLRLHPESRLYAFEINREFVASLRTIRDRRLTVLERSAEELQSGIGGAKVDCIVSSLPLGAFDVSLRERIVRAVQDSLAHGGVFAQYQYAPSAYPLLKRTFGEVAVSFEFRNAPPACIYTCRQPRP